ncbi:polysaccharide deacetylase [Pseudonocardia hierapolitana]|uniref:Polysaccharide deacetylase n=1 Tax=Pseudonocardia hierapolitana TaxID=1128676 RepID=A0A561SVS2_9PSEU|nr:polysaccharide deacetylase family protein [Pseudonocardia hierapolitana]TWF78964.1 polysaccharide deacetylase [Pseudonocardia hierapolitana]
MQQREGGRLVVFGWHNVEPTWYFAPRRGSGPHGLTQQLRLLRTFANVLPLESALADLTAGRPLPPRAVALTFDDGYRDNLTVAGPILRDLGLPATCFLVPGLLSRTTRAWWEELAHAVANATANEIVWKQQKYPLRTTAERRATLSPLAQALKDRDRTSREAAVDEVVELLAPRRRYHVDETFMDWDEAARLRDYMTIGSHSLHHAILAQEDDDAQTADLCSARAQLQDGLGVEAPVLAYPNGSASDYGTGTFEAAHRAGHSHAVTTRPGVNRATTPRYEVRRIMMNPERGAVELTKILRDAVAGGR